MFVLNVDLWNEDGTREVNLVRSSTGTPSISSTTPYSYTTLNGGDVTPVSYNQQVMQSTRDSAYGRTPAMGYVPDFQAQQGYAPGRCDLGRCKRSPDADETSSSDISSQWHVWPSSAIFPSTPGLSSGPGCPISAVAGKYSTFFKWTFERLRAGHKWRPPHGSCRGPAFGHVYEKSHW